MEQTTQLPPGEVTEKGEGIKGNGGTKCPHEVRCCPRCLRFFFYARACYLALADAFDVRPPGRPLVIRGDACSIGPETRQTTTGTIFLLQLGISRQGVCEGWISGACICAHFFPYWRRAAVLLHPCAPCLWQTGKVISLYNSQRHAPTASQPRLRTLGEN